MENIHMWLTFAVITATIFAYAFERWSIEGVSLAALVSLLAIFSLVPQDLANPVSATDPSATFAFVTVPSPSMVRFTPAEETAMSISVRGIKRK